MKSDKAPCKSQLTTDMLKSLPEVALSFIIETIQEFWQQPNSTYCKRVKQPTRSQQLLGHMLKRNLCQNNKLHHIKPTTTTPKPFGPKTQFGMIGCQEAQHMLKKALLLRQQHRIPTYRLSKLKKETINIKYNTGVQQRDNASPVLFAYIIQVFLDTLKIEIKLSEFRHFKPPKMETSKH